MPELPEVETVRRGLAPAMEGSRIDQVDMRRPDLRFPMPQGFVEKLEGRRIETVSRRAKYLLVTTDDGQTLIMHLGMSGSFRIEVDVASKADNTDFQGVFFHPKSQAQKHDHVVFHLSAGQSKITVIYNDPRRFGFMDLIPSAGIDGSKHFAGMGIEPTGNSFGPAALATMFHNKQAPLKAALLDQRLVAGLGNIYVCEALWRSSLSPRRKAGSIVTKSGLPTDRCTALAGHIRDVIQEAIAAGGASLRDHRQTSGELGYFQHSFKAYDQEGQPCPKPECGGTIARIVQSGRSTFYCTKCQR